MARKIFLLSFLLLCLGVFGIAGPGFAADRANGDVISQLQSQGWTIVNDGVLKRELRAGEVEYFVFGVKGFTWKLNDLKMQYRRLEIAYRATPTAEIKAAIANHRKEIGSTLRMIELARGAEQQGLADLPKDSCTINFNYDAAASWKTAVQGVWAEGKAGFSATCPGFTGEVYAYALAETTVNGGPYSKTVTDGPRSSGNASAYAYADANGASPCHSYAYASMTSSNLNPSSYSKAAENFSCPPVISPLSVSITSGPTSIDLRTLTCKSVTWTAAGSGGNGVYTYTWTIDGSAYTTTTSTFTTTICRGWGGGFTLGVTVRDSANTTPASTSRWVSVLEPTCTNACLCAAVSSSSSKIVPICP
jgi:hypothetical protein